MGKEVDFDEGHIRIIQAYRLAPKPYFIGVYGHPNSGKKHLISRLAHPHDDFEIYNDLVNQKFIEKIFENDELKEKIHIFRCPWERDYGISRQKPIVENDIDFILGQIPGRGKGVNFSVGIYAPCQGYQLKNPNNYNLVIRNDKAIPKGSEGIGLDMAKATRGFKKGSFRQ
jgi:hypothetical protein